MRILALDTTARAGSAAVMRDGVVLAERIGDPALSHGQRLPSDLMRVLEAAGLQLGDIDLFAVAAGPGSFTGLRVGIATIQGLALATARAVVPISTLEALAWSVADGSRPIAAWMDAQRGQVFAELYDVDARDGAGGRHVRLAATSETPASTLAAWQAAGFPPTRFVGDGAVRYRDEIAAAVPGAEIVAPPPLAATLAQIAHREPSRAVAPHALVPIYVRRTDAEIARDKRSAQV